MGLLFHSHGTPTKLISDTREAKPPREIKGASLLSIG